MMMTSEKKTQIDLFEDLPIPDKRYFTIGEASRLCNLKPHVLRYWEQEFSQLRPNKRRGNRRYYQQKDILMIRQIRHLLYDKGFTISGARSQLSGKQRKANGEKGMNAFVKETIGDLQDLLAILERDHLKSEEDPRSIDSSS